MGSLVNIGSIMDFFVTLTGDIDDIGSVCSELGRVLKLVGIVVLGIKVVVPIILIVVGMIDMAKAVNEKSEDKIKSAQQALIKKAIAAVIVFLVTTIVVALVGLVANSEEKEGFDACMSCVQHPFDSSKCKISD